MIITKEQKEFSKLFIECNNSYNRNQKEILKPENALKRETNLNLFVNDYVNEDQH